MIHQGPPLLLFSERNLFYAAIIYEMIGALLICYALRLKTAGKTTQEKRTPPTTTDQHQNAFKTIIQNHHMKIMLGIVIFSIIIPKFGKAIEAATTEKGLFCIDNIVYLFIYAVISLVYFLICKFKTLMQKEQRQEDIPYDKIILSLGVITMASGFLVLSSS